MIIDRYSKEDLKKITDEIEDFVKKRYNRPPVSPRDALFHNPGNPNASNPGR